SYATLDGSNSVVAYVTPPANVLPTMGWTSSASTEVNNYEVSGVGGAFGVSRFANTVRYTGAAGNQSLGSRTLVLSGLMNVGSGTLTISSGAALRIGSTQELVLNAANAGIAISSTITDNTSGTSSLTIAGPSGVTLSGSNTYTGGTTITSGSLTLSGGTLGSGGLHVASGASLNIDTSQTISQAVTGSGAISTTKTTTLSGDFSGFSGTFAHSATSTSDSTAFISTLAASKDAAYSITTAQTNGQGLILGVFTGANTFELGSLSGVAGSLLRNSTSVNAGTINTLRVGNLNTDTEFAGTLGGGGGTVALEKVGNGTLTLSGTNAYTGDTLVSAGTLLVTGALGNTAVTVDGGTFGGTGVVGGSFSLDSGFFHVADLADPLDVTGTVTLFSGFGVGDLLGLNWSEVTNGTYTLINGTLGTGVFGSLANNSLISAFDLGSGRSAYFQEGSLQLVVVPEPGAALLGSLGVLALLRRRRA
ncbi:MAG: autotransporter-associated beta strand repeat-containing protein, partial [Verrucomicrobiae bacterium]|nr:autotransporter-associated beta strand repeat-containing protein [Verrucomicrobiae bacterium]